PVNSLELLGKDLPSGKILTEDNIEEWIENLLPPQGVSGEYDATVWDWVKETRPVEDPDDTELTIQAPLYFTEPEDTTIWANFASATPGERREMLFDPETGQLSYPLFSPHLGKRPPFAAGAHGPAPYLISQEDANSMPTNINLPDLFTEPITPFDPETPIRESKWFPLCPEGSPIKRYNVVAITLPIAYNTFGDEDDDGQIFVLAEDVDDVLSGKKPAEPLALRANLGDCIQYTLTSKLVDFEENHDFSKVNYHHHLMQFDPLASDGVISGFGYEQSVRPFATEDVNLDREAKEGDLQIIVNDGSKFKNGIWIAIAMGTNDIELHRIAEISRDEKTITLTEPLVRDHPRNEAVGVEFVRQAFYADATVGVVYNHDHVAGHVSWGHGLFGAIIIEPKDSTYHDPSTGERVRSGAIVDIHTDNPVAIDRPGESFREMTLWIQDAAAHIEGVGEPEVGGGGSSFNLRAESFEGRLDNNPDSSLLFSSVTHGDPATPIFRAYEEDPLVIRLLQGASNEVHIFRIMDHRFNLERFPDAAVTDSLHIGIAEQFNIFLEDAAGNPGAGKAGDYLYYDPDAFRFAEGMWGILRVHDTLQDSLKVLPGRTPPPEGPGFPELTQTGGRPPEPPDAGEPCPAGAPLREFDVVAMPANIVFNERIGIDNNGMIFALAADVPGILSGAKAIDPLVLRGNAGDCIEVTLTNNLDSRVSMHLGKLLADPQRSLGITLGFNFDQSVLPGEWITYRVYADRELGAGIIADFANDISGMEEGLYGAIIIGPENSNYFDPETGSEISAGWQAMVTNDDPSIETYKDFVLIFQEQDPIIGRNLMPYPSETEGISAINYRTEPLEKRKEPVLSSLVNGDPETPLMMATLGEPVKIHVLQGFGHQVHVFGINGHYWSSDPNIPGANILSSRAIGPHESMDISLVGGAGGTQQGVGDYLYLNHRMPFFEGGQWGILRVTPSVLPNASPVLIVPALPTNVDELA
ncbi:MAG: hypothetical protein V3T23_02415, partial [Nitrososphaerales archaeon]